MASVKPGRMYGTHTASSPNSSAISASPFAAPAIMLIASGCVWSTCGASTNACSSVSIEERGISGATCERDRYATICSSLISSRSISGRTSSRRMPVNPEASIVARSEPEPLTHRTATSRPVWSVSTLLAEVLPPPKFETARLAPSRFER